MLAIDEPLYVITPLFNPRRSYSHLANQGAFNETTLSQPEVILITVEMAFGNRRHELSRLNDRHYHLRLRGQSELWVKENLINLAVQRLPEDWRYVAWIDGDVTFTRPDWAAETLHALQHYDVIQPWSDCIDMGPELQVVQSHKSFCRQYVRGEPRVINSYGGQKPGVFWHPGYAWAARRSAFEQLGGLFDTAVLGSSDHHMALSLIGEGAKSVPGGIHPHYLRNVLNWQDRAAQLHQNIGYIEGAITHAWHGRKADRRYVERWQILIDNQFDPDADLRRNFMGIWELAPDRWQLRDAIRNYFANRLDDANTLT